MYRINSAYPNLSENDGGSRNNARNQNIFQIPNRDKNNNLSFAHQKKKLTISPSSNELKLFNTRNNFLNEERKERDNKSFFPFFGRNNEDYSNELEAIGYPRIYGNNGIIYPQMRNNLLEIKCQICNKEIENVPFKNSMNLHEQNDRCKAAVHFHCIFFYMKRAIENNKEGLESLDFIYNCQFCKKTLTNSKIDEIGLDVLKVKFKQCQVCFNYKHEKYLFFTGKCNHISCRECANTYYKTKIIEEKKEDLTCLQCNAQVNYEILKTTVSSRTLLRYSELLLNRLLKEESSAEVFIRCPKNNCNSIVCFPKNYIPNVIKCIACSYAFCGKGCGSAHPNMTCKEALENKKKRKGENEQKNEQLFQLLVRNENVKLCPQCKAYSQKIDGCNHVKCLKCKYEYCFACLVKYGTCGIH